MRFLAGKIAVSVLSLLGAIFCFLNAAGAKLFCVTQGCKIYSGYGLFGISFYVYGLAGFLLILALVLLYPRAGTPFWLPAVIAIALALDSLFLFYQFLFWPCASCLVAALLLGLTALAGLLLLRMPGRLFLWVLMLIWLVLFGYVGLAAVKEAAFRPWAIAGAPDAPIQVFFSPVCPACRETVTRILDNPELAEQVAFFPVIKSEKDEERLASFLHADPAGRDLNDLFRDSPAGGRLTGEEKRRLQMNKMALARHGIATVPLVISSYLPVISPPRQENSIDSPFAPPGGSPLAPQGFAPAPPVPGCSAFESTPDCDSGEQ